MSFDLRHLQKILTLASEGRRFAPASVIRARGSTPQKSGANATIEATGTIWGTLGGGCLEAECMQRALRSLDIGEPCVFDLNLDDVQGWDDGLICGGNVRVLINPAVTENLNTYRAVIEARQRDTPGLLVTIIQHPSAQLGAAYWIADAELDQHPITKGMPDLEGVMEAGAPTWLETKEPVTQARVELYVEPVLPLPHVIIAGAGHIGKAVCELAASVDFDVTVIDDRPSFADPKRLPEATNIICGDIAEELAQQTITARTYVLIVTRGHRHDAQVLAACVNSPAAYIGMIGSRRKGMLIRKEIIERGIAPAETVNRVVSPIGLEIGAISVNEIAISIVAQLVGFRNCGSLSAEAKNFLKPGGVEGPQNPSANASANTVPELSPS